MLWVVSLWQLGSRPHCLGNCQAAKNQARGRSSDTLCQQSCFSAAQAFASRNRRHFGHDEHAGRRATCWRSGDVFFVQLTSQQILYLEVLQTLVDHSDTVISCL